MAEICCGLVSEGEAPAAACETGSPAARRRRMEIRRFKLVAGAARPEPTEGRQKRQKLQVNDTASFSRECENAIENCAGQKTRENLGSGTELLSPTSLIPKKEHQLYPKYGVASVCGRRRDMEDAVAVHPSFCRRLHELHYFGVYDGHGCSHVAMKCRERLHELVKEEVEKEMEWKSAMERSFGRMDEEVVARGDSARVGANCRCELRTPECDAVGSTAVVAIITPDKIIVANCGDSRAVLCRNSRAVPLSSDHKPDRPDELNRIQAAGGRVIFWDGPRVLGVLAMSRAIGDNYLKPYVSCEPEVTVTERTAEDECLILASDGLWDVVSNETACRVASKCLRGAVGLPPPTTEVGEDAEEAVVGSGSEAKGRKRGETWDEPCTDASTLLMKLALARHSADNVSVVVVDLRRDT